jgi:hypothetical protein
MMNCSYRAFTDGTCCTGIRCRSETAHIQIRVDQAPLIRPFSNRTIALLGLVAAIVGGTLAYGLGSSLEEYFHQQDLASQESIAWKR